MAKIATMEINIRYTADHAVAVHENPSKHDPRSWRNTTVDWSSSPGGPKFLETPLKAAVPGMAQRMAMKAFDTGSMI